MVSEISYSVSEIHYKVTGFSFAMRRLFLPKDPPHIPWLNMFEATVTTLVSDFLLDPRGSVAGLPSPGTAAPAIRGPESTQCSIALAGLQDVVV